jgi:nucleoside-diphosphate-sugar epimerase
VRVFILGGTGSIGSPVVQELTKRGHDVFGLARSDVSAAKLAEFGATPVDGDIASPERWAASLQRLDAVIHAACDFNTAMGAIDARLLDVLLPSLATQPKKSRFIYTGGCWLFGATGDDIVTEETRFRPLPAFAWMVPQLRRILEAPEVDGIVIHPATV